MSELQRADNADRCLSVAWRPHLRRRMISAPALPRAVEAIDRLRCRSPMPWRCSLSAPTSPRAVARLLACRALGRRVGAWRHQSRAVPRRRHWSTRAAVTVVQRPSGASPPTVAKRTCGPASERCMSAQTGDILREVGRDGRPDGLARCQGHAGLLISSEPRLPAGAGRRLALGAADALPRVVPPQQRAPAGNRVPIGRRLIVSWGKSEDRGVPESPLADTDAEAIVGCQWRISRIHGPFATMRVFWQNRRRRQSTVRPQPVRVRSRGAGALEAR